MRSFSGLMAGAGLILSAFSVSAADSDSELSWHFDGIDAVLESNPESIWSDVAQIEPAHALEGQIKAHIADWLPGRLGWIENNWAGGTPLIRSIIDYVFSHETMLHVKGDDIADASWAFGISVTGEENKEFRSALLKIGRQFKLSEPVATNISGLDGWVLKLPDGKICFSFVGNGEWVLVSNDINNNEIANRWASAVSAGGHPGDKNDETWLRLRLDPSIFGWRFGLPSLGEIATIRADYSWQGSNVRTISRVEFTDELELEFEKWKTPKDLVLDPLVSFTAARGTKKWMRSFAAAKDLPEDLLPDQLFNWSRGNISFISEFAVPVPDSGKTFKLLSKSVPKEYGPWIMERSLGQWLSVTNSDRMLWRGLPVFVPYFDSVESNGQDFIKGGIFPIANERSTEPAPDALYEQFENREGLIYYDWEITAARIETFRQAERFASLVFPPAEKGEATFAIDWMNLIYKKLENSITEATVAGSHEVDFVRKSAVGFTGVELWLLSHWFDSEKFPEFPYSAPEKRGVPSAAPGQKPLPRAQPVTR